MKMFIYIDYENVNNLKTLIDLEGKYFIFVGASQKNIDSELVLSSNNKMVEWIRISGNGKNALDFHLVYTLSVNSNEKDVEHIILSKDTGFDPLILTLNNKNINVRRVINITDVNEKIKSDMENGSVDKILHNLLKINKTKRPQSVNKLEAHIKSFDKTYDDITVHEAIEELFRKNIISTSSGSRIKYLD